MLPVHCVLIRFCVVDAATAIAGTWPVPVPVVVGGGGVETDDVRVVVTLGAVTEGMTIELVGSGSPHAVRIAFENSVTVCQRRLRSLISARSMIGPISRGAPIRSNT